MYSTHAHVHTQTHSSVRTMCTRSCSHLRLHTWVDIQAHTHTHMYTHTLCAQTHSKARLPPDGAPVADARDSVSAADVEGVEGPGLRDVDDAWVLSPEYRVIPQPGDPERHQQESEGEGVEEEEAVAVQEEALALLVQDEGQHGEEGEDEEDEDLALGDQVPEEAREVRRVLWHPCVAPFPPPRYHAAPSQMSSSNKGAQETIWLE